MDLFLRGTELDAILSRFPLGAAIPGSRAREIMRLRRMNDKGRARAAADRDDQRVIEDRAR
jgi:hypothetical protein